MQWRIKLVWSICFNVALHLKKNRQKYQIQDLLAWTQCCTLKNVGACPFSICYFYHQVNPALEKYKLRTGNMDKKNPPTLPLSLASSTSITSSKNSFGDLFIMLCTVRSKVDHASLWKTIITLVFGKLEAYDFLLQLKNI